jgi:8-oxo-dGTP pyrophosphatase MutT (NUDIX family)
MKVIQLDHIQITINKDKIPEAFDAVVVILFCSDQFVMVWNPERGWEFPGGHREGKETYRETAIREVWEEAQIEIQNLGYLGYYTLKTGHLTLIVRADCPTFEGRKYKKTTSKLKVFDALPSQLSFGDGREQLFLDVARKFRNLS